MFTFCLKNYQVIYIKEEKKNIKVNFKNKCNLLSTLIHLLNEYITLNFKKYSIMFTLDTNLVWIFQHILCKTLSKSWLCNFLYFFFSFLLAPLLISKLLSFSKFFLSLWKRKKLLKLKLVWNIEKLIEILKKQEKIWVKALKVDEIPFKFFS